MAVPLLTTKIVKKRVKHFKRAHSDRYIGLKVARSFPLRATPAVSVPEPRHFEMDSSNKQPLSFVSSVVLALFPACSARHRCVVCFRCPW
jgi:hypothetical protein